MKKRNWILLCVTAVFLLGLAACGDETKAKKEETVTPLIDCSQVQIDASMEDYFQGDLQKTVKELEPLLVPAMSLYAKDGVTVFLGGPEDDMDLKWQIVLSQISNYGDEVPVDAGDGGQNYIVTEETVGRYFNSSFAGNTTGAPEIPRIYESMYSGKTGEYTIPAHLELPRVYGVMKSVSLSKGNSADDPTMSATMEFTLTTPLNGNPDKPFGEIGIEIVKNTKSIYGYSLQSLSFTSVR